MLPPLPPVGRGMGDGAVMLPSCGAAPGGSRSTRRSDASSPRSPPKRSSAGNPGPVTLAQGKPGLSVCWS